MTTPIATAGTPPISDPQNRRFRLAHVFAHSSPDSASVTSAAKIFDGGGKKRGSTTPTRTRISHSASSASGDTMLISRSRLVADIASFVRTDFGCVGGSGVLMRALPSRAHPKRLLVLGARASHLVAQLIPDREHELAVIGPRAQLEHVARPLEGDVDERLRAARMRGHHHDAVAERHRLVHAVRDEKHCLLRLVPDAQQLFLQQRLVLLVE